MPISKIKVGDMFVNPQRVVDGKIVSGNIYIVEEISEKDNLVKVQAYDSWSLKPIQTPFWRRGSDTMFSEDWRWDL